MTATWAVRPAMEVLARRAQHLAWLKTAPFRSYGREWLSRHSVGHLVDISPDAFPDALAGQWDAPALIPARTATATLYSAAAALVDEGLPPLLPDDLPSPSGMLFLPVTLYGRHDGHDVGASVLSWGPCAGHNGRPGTFITSWVHTDETQDDAVARAVQESLLSQGNRRGVPQYLLRQATVYWYGQERDLGLSLHTSHRKETRALRDTDPEVDSLPYRVLCALWSMLSTGLLTTEVVTIPPRTRERLGDHETLGVGMRDGQGGDLITVRATRVVDPHHDREQFVWDASTALGGRAAV